jgi:hypothetical protein
MKYKKIQFCSVCCNRPLENEEVSLLYELNYLLQQLSKSDDFDLFMGIELFVATCL